MCSFVVVVLDIDLNRLLSWVSLRFSFSVEADDVLCCLKFTDVSRAKLTWINCQRCVVCKLMNFTSTEKETNTKWDPCSPVNEQQPEGKV